MIIFNITVDDLIYKERKLVYLNSRGESYEDALKTIDELYNISLVIRNNSAIKFLPEDADLVFNCYDGNLSDNSYVFVKSNKTNGFSIKRAVSIN
ncbi:hypothetical protein AT251_23310 [Enterovibrio nigricans]|nr:hypothetical protein [Enterovibrio nigricans]PKF48830.1 hypothetical protein AT251_23310 [Enterovibrio nigricans]